MPFGWVEIDLAALRRNFSKARERLEPQARIVGVVKSDAYGHGMVPVARELEALGARFLAVSEYWEGEVLREAGLKLPIIVLLGVEPHEMKSALRHDMRPVLYRRDHADALSKTAVELRMEARFHLKVDTGMGRLGVPMEDLSDFLDHLKELPGLSMEGILSHFAVADEPDKTYSEFQTQRFRDALGVCRRHGFPFKYAHISNSAGLLDLTEAQFQLVRPGIMLYGAPPSHDLLRPVSLDQVMSFKTRVIQVKEVAAGCPIGYGRTFVTQRPTIIATLPVGYNDGYPRCLSNKGMVLVRGQRAPLVGRVSMSMITVDVTHIPGICRDDEVVLLGSQRDAIITADEIAELSGTISYEIFCNIGKHRDKRFLNAYPGT